VAGGSILQVSLKNRICSSQSERTALGARKNILQWCESRVNCSCK